MGLFLTPAAASSSQTAWWRNESTPYQLILGAIRRLRIEHARVAEFERHRAGFAERHRAIKTRAAAGVAGAGDLLDLDPDRVLVAVNAHLDDALGVTGSLALLPQRAPRTAEIPCLAGGDGFCQRLGIHVRDHQHIARNRVGGDAGDEPIGVEFRRQRRTLFERGARSRRCEGYFVGQRSPPLCRRQPAAAAPRTSVTNRIWSSGLSRNVPRNRVVTVETPGLLTPRTDMQVCSASISTATPCGLSTSSIAGASWEVSRSWVCNRRA